MILVVRGGAFLVIQQVLGCRADPHAARHTRPGAERAQPDRPPPLPFQPADELSKIERRRDIKLLDHGGGMPPSRACAHCSPQYARCDSRQEQGAEAADAFRAGDGRAVTYRYGTSRRMVHPFRPGFRHIARLFIIRVV